MQTASYQLLQLIIGEALATKRLTGGTVFDVAVVHAYQKSFVGV